VLKFTYAFDIVCLRQLISFTCCWSAQSVAIAS